MNEMLVQSAVGITECAAPALGGMPFKRPELAPKSMPPSYVTCCNVMFVTASSAITCKKICGMPVPILQI